MLDLKKIFFKGASSALPEELQVSLAAWRDSRAPALDDLHFHVPYVVVDIASAGANPATDPLLGIAATTLRHSTILPSDAFYADLATPVAPGLTVDQQLTAFLRYAAKAPLVTYHAAFVAGFLQRAYRERLGIDFTAYWIDLALLLPALFDEISDTLMPLDHWLDALGWHEGGGRRDAMANTLLLARLFQRLLVRAVARRIDTAASLLDESQASLRLRRN